jgi:hypothetical protein
MKYGLEKEFFVRNEDGDLVVCPRYKLPADEVGYLAEARGKPASNIRDAVFNLKSEIYRMHKIAKKMGLWLDDTPVLKVPAELKIEAQRRYAKGIISYQNMYGYAKHKNLVTEGVAGVHISFTDPHEIVHYCEYKKLRLAPKTWTINKMFDYIQIFRKLDEAFKDEIKQAKRRPGFYEIKSDGRIEYRSLPSNVDLDKIIEILS